jgi:hypothetical protein
VVSATLLKKKTKNMKEEEHFFLFHVVQGHVARGHVAQGKLVSLGDGVLRLGRVARGHVAGGQCCSSEKVSFMEA